MSQSNKRQINGRILWVGFKLTSLKLTDKILCRLLSVVMAGLGLLLLSPLFFIRIVQSKWSNGCIFSKRKLVGQQGHIFTAYQFTQTGIGQTLPILWNILRGDMLFAGPRPLTQLETHKLPSKALFRFNVTPGLYSIHTLKQHTGIDYQSEIENDFEFVYNTSISDRISLVFKAWLTSGHTKQTVELPTPQHIHLLQIPLYNTTMSEAINHIIESVKTNKRQFIAFANADCLNIACQNSQYQKVLQHQAHRVLADGSGIRLGCKMLKVNLLANVNGTDLFPQLCQTIEHENISIYLLGAKEGVAQAVAENMQQRYPNLSIAGTQHGYFSQQQTPEVIEAINQSKADILLVAYGAPRQELWIAEHQDQLKPAVCMGVGGLFDFYSGRIPRAPIWLRELGMEWVWRLLQEPQRMWRRYIIGNPLFLYRVWRQVRAKKQQSLKSSSMNHHFTDSAFARIGRNIRFYWLCWQVFLVKRVSPAMKRLVDIIVAGSMLIFLAPFLIMVATAIRIDTVGPPLFFQKRTGRDGKLFRMWKFRSMYQDAEARKAALMKQNEMEGGVLFKMKKDPRITPAGEFIRKFSIDELPQLWNVLKGDMSLVGPRPPIPYEVAQYSAYQRQRLGLEPGITCIWQVSGRSDIPFPQQVEMDLDYINQQSFFFDIELMFKTVPAVLKGRGAY
ncbi:WecB/TagA/CpsF family glycosyltransferase [Candidatus Albibeggiatoa sp. nov. NOAA]|uniref:WecB/TagA/CpsF family glycosyltransferase n=1 Tax=Candidatus Albibeggiatoa sp. nov. NOAA TaxID=3162724 RepID=UPI0032FED320|nr:WecB/TagA/CpsF family glycosyltransferase [Thiotrichaceae bacterium]